MNNFIKPDIEHSLIVSLVINPDEYFNHEISRVIFTDRRQILFDCVKKIIESGCQPDLVTIKESVGDTYTASELVTILDSPFGAKLEYYINILETARQRRELHTSLTKAFNMVKDGSELAEIESVIKSGIANIETSEPETMVSVLNDLMEQLELESQGMATDGLKTGFGKLDYITGGFVPGDFIVVAARPRMGKSSWAMNVAKNFSYNGYPGFVESLEMPLQQLTRRMVCDVGRIDGEYLFQGKLRRDQSVWPEIHNTTEIISKFPIIFDRSTNIRVEQICSRLRKAKSINGIEWAVIDYLQLIQDWNKDGQGIKSYITGQLKNIAGELGIRLIVLSQMNREFEKRQQKIPQLSDLKDGGNLEADATHIIFPVIETIARNGVTRQTHGDEFEYASLYLAKNRNGSPGKIDVKWQGHYYSYSDKNETYGGY